MKNLTEALKFLDMGISVIPISHREKRPDKRRLIKTGDFENRTSRTGRDFKAASWEKYKTELPDRVKVLEWFSSDRPGVGVITGWNNLVVIDFDNMIIYNLWESWREKNKFPQPYKVKTSRGVHAYYFLKKPMERTLTSSLGIDIKFTGYVLAPPSVHPSGHVYEKMLSADNITTIEDIEEVLPFDIFLVSNFKQPELNTSVNTKPFGIFDVPEMDIDVKERVKILSFFPNARQTGKDFYMDLCPLHPDRSPSFWINDRLNRCGCYSGCITGSGSVIDFYAKLKGIDDQEAIDQLRMMA
jgi:hypothetical protein